MTDRFQKARRANVTPLPRPPLGVPSQALRDRFIAAAEAEVNASRERKVALEAEAEEAYERIMGEAAKAAQAEADARAMVHMLKTQAGVA